jgi:hypothetical protein
MRNRVCVKKAATRDGYGVVSGATYISHTLGVGSGTKGWYFFDSGKWEEREGTTIKDSGEWNCDGPDNYFIWAGNEQFLSKTKIWTPMNTIFNCVKEELESRNMKYEFTSNELKLLFPRDKQHWTFYEDGKWGKFNTEDNSVVIDGTWECDGEEEYKVFTDMGIYNSKLNSWT